MIEYVKVPKDTMLSLLTEISLGANSMKVRNLAIELEQESKPFITEDKQVIRTFNTGATRDIDINKLDYEGFLSPAVIKRYAEYLNKHRVQSDGNIRDSDNWQKGIPKDVYMKSLWRHFIDMWSEHRKIKTEAGMEDAICGIMFNSMGYMFEVLKENNEASMSPEGK